MHTEYSYNGLDLAFPVRRAFTNCAEEIEKKVPDLKDLHFAVRKSPDRAETYEIDLRAVSKATDVVSTLETNNIYSGLKALKHATIKRLRDDKKKTRDKSRRKNKHHQLNHINEEFNFKEAL